jgi:hypothetical protein
VMPAISPDGHAGGGDGTLASLPSRLRRRCLACPARRLRNSPCRAIAVTLRSKEHAPGNRRGGRVREGPHPPLTAIRCSFRERRPGYERQRGDTGRARDRERGIWVPGGFVCGARKTDFRGLEPGEEISQDWGN